MGGVRRAQSVKVTPPPLYTVVVVVVTTAEGGQPAVHELGAAKMFNAHEVYQLLCDATSEDIQDI